MWAPELPVAVDPLLSDLQMLLSGETVGKVEPDDGDHRRDRELRDDHLAPGSFPPIGTARQDRRDSDGSLELIGFPCIGAKHVTRSSFRLHFEVVTDRTRQAKSWPKVLAADRRSENGKAPFPGLFE
jgi:hypothetical protein